MDEEVPNNLLEEEIPFTSNLTNYTEQSVRMVNSMRTAFVDNSPSTTERVTTPVDMDITGMDGPLDPAFTRPTLQTDTDLDAQPTKGPREVGDATNDLLDQYMDENYTDVLRTSLLNPSSYLSLPSVKKSPQQGTQKLMAMDWYVPDGSNRRLIEIEDTRIADFRSPGGGAGAMTMTLPNLMLHYQTTKYLVDVETGELFGWIANQWRRTGLYCSAQPFVLRELSAMTTRCSAVLRMDLEQEQQTSVMQLSGEAGANKVQLPPLPLMPEPDAYVTQADVMSPQMRRNYVRDRTQAALTYIKEYETSHQWEQDPQYDAQQVRQRLQIVYGKADQVKQRIDVALLNDDIYRRRRVMRTLELPLRFPSPQTIKDSSVVTWVQWIREESNKLIAAIDDEITRRQDPDDPFDGTASGIFPALQHTAGIHQKDIKVDESTSRSPRTTEGTQIKLVDIHSPRQVDLPQQNQQKTASVLQGSRSTQARVSDASQSRVTEHEQQGEAVTVATSISTQRRVEESQPEAAPEVEQETEDPFRTLRSFHEKQREERQGEDRARTSVASHSTLEGAVGGTVTQYPKPQRQTQKNIKGGSQYKAIKHQENNQPPQNNFYQGPHDTTAYMELPNGLRNKICGKCGLMGHIKKFCKEEVYCKYCRVYTHSTAACRTYPATSSRKNTPEKRTQEDIDQEVNRRVQKDLLRILADITTNRQIDMGNPEVAHPNQGLPQVRVPKQIVSGSNPYQHIPQQTKRVQELINELQRPSEVAEREHSANDNGQEMGVNNQDSILNQQWDDRLQLQPPLRPTSVSTLQAMDNPSQPNPTTEASTAIPATRRQVETTVTTVQGQHTHTPETIEAQSTSTRVTNSQPNLTTPATNRPVEGSVYHTM